MARQNDPRAAKPCRFGAYATQLGQVLGVGAGAATIGEISSIVDDKDRLLNRRAGGGVNV